MLDRPSHGTADVAALLEDALTAIEDGPLALDLPHGTRLRIDRFLPFLLVHRQIENADDEVTRLIHAESAWMVGNADIDGTEEMRRAVTVLATKMREDFAGGALIEIWTRRERSPEHREDSGPEHIRPRFRIVCPRRHPTDRLLDLVEEALTRMKLDGLRAQVDVEFVEHFGPDRAKPLVGNAELEALGLGYLGIEIDPVFRDQAGLRFPPMFRKFKRAFIIALRRALHEYLVRGTKFEVAHYHGLGARAVNKRVLDVDRRIAEVADKFSFLVQVTPFNAEAAWSEFESGGFEARPVFHYRPLPVDPVVLKRELFAIPVEKVVDPALGLLLRRMQDELDRKITALSDIDTPRFISTSLQLYGSPSGELQHRALELLDALPSDARDGRDGFLDAGAFAERARREFAFYRDQRADFSARVEISDATAGSMMVSRNRLLLAPNYRVPLNRVEALVAHEIGTHIVTWFNGRAQPLRQLSLGFPGYESLQEGLAVFSEYLVGGLSLPRLRMLAGRVMAVATLVDGADFVETFRLLHLTHGFTASDSFTVTMRVYRGGGFTKDAVYLEGFLDVLAWIRNGGKLEELYLGKISLELLPLVRELVHRHVLDPLPLAPRIVELEETKNRLDRVRQTHGVIDLIQE